MGTGSRTSGDPFQGKWVWNGEKRGRTGSGRTAHYSIGRGAGSVGVETCVRTAAQARSWSADTRVRRQLTLYLVLKQGLSWFLPFLLILRASWPPGLLCTSVSTSHLTLPHTALYVTSESQTVVVTLVQQGFHPLNHFSSQ